MFLDIRNKLQLRKIVELFELFYNNKLVDNLNSLKKITKILKKSDIKEKDKEVIFYDVVLKKYTSNKIIKYFF